MRKWYKIKGDICIIWEETNIRKGNKYEKWGVMKKTKRKDIERQRDKEDKDMK